MKFRKKPLHPEFIQLLIYIFFKYPIYEQDLPQQWNLLPDSGIQWLYQSLERTKSEGNRPLQMTIQRMRLKIRRTCRTHRPLLWWKRWRCGCDPEASEAVTRSWAGEHRLFIQSRRMLWLPEFIHLGWPIKRVRYLRFRLSLRRNWAHLPKTDTSAATSRHGTPHLLRKPKSK